MPDRVQWSAGLAAWPGLELVRPLAGGHRNPVLLARCRQEQLVVRRSGRPAAALEWELDLLAHLWAHGIRVPELVPAADGRRQVAGLVVTRFVPGAPPRDPADWRRVVDALATVHQLTRGWPQRPGFAASRQLLTAPRGGDVGLDRMPERAVAAVRRAWRPVQQGPASAVHGDVGGGNLLVDGAAVTLLDWDEARVDVPWFDYAFVPEQVPVPWPGRRAELTTAGVAWEAATCWQAEPVYARRRLLELYRRLARADRD